MRCDATLCGRAGQIPPASSSLYLSGRHSLGRGSGGTTEARRGKGGFIGYKGKGASGPTRFRDAGRRSRLGPCCYNGVIITCLIRSRDCSLFPGDGGRWFAPCPGLGELVLGETGDAQGPELAVSPR